MAAIEALKLAPLRNQDDGDMADHFISSESESEDGGSKCENVLKVIETLDKQKQKRKRLQRSEPNLKVSEFHLSSNTDGDKVDLNDLIGSLQKGSSYGGLKKKLVSMEKNSAPMDLPLHKPQAEKIQRTVAYEETSADVGKWQPIVKKNREAEHLSFPLNPYKPAKMTTRTLAVTFKPRTPLEEEVAAILRGSSHVIERENKELTEEEEQALLAMDLEEAKERRRELQRMRALQSYYEEKCRRAKKIKSKKYHRVKKRSEKRAASKLSLEELQKTDPEKAMEELEKMEKIRATERVSLKHRNTSKWAKNLIIHGHKDPEAKRALQEQLVLSRQLTEKQREESDAEEETGAETDDVTSGTYGGLVTSADNPWSIDTTGDRGRTGTGDGDAAEPVTKLQRLQPIAGNEESGNDAEGLESSEEKQDEDDFELQLNKPEKKSKKAKGKKKKKKAGPEDKSTKDNCKGVKKRNTESLGKMTLKTGAKPAVETKSTKTKHKGKIIQSKSIEEEKDQPNKAVLLLSHPEQPAHDQHNKDIDNDAETTDGQLDFLEGVTRKEAQTETRGTKSGFSEPKRAKSQNKGVTIDPKKIFCMEETSDAIGRDESHDLSIQQAFTNDDVTEEFVREKDEAAASSKPKDIDLTLPGWGEWGGAGVKPSQKKRQQFVVRVEPGSKRKDQNLAHVIINEERNRKFARNQVKNIPHPFSSRTQFERSIRNPVGKHWNTASTVKQLTKPCIQTLMGTIIEPIAAPKELKRRTTLENEGETTGKKYRKKCGDGVGLVFHE